MEEIKAPKKERRFLKAIGRVAGVLVQELALGLGRKYIGKMINKIKIPKKRETLSFLLLLSCTFAFAQYPTTNNKQRLGFQTTADGLVWRGRASDTFSLKSTGLNNAYIIIDTLQNVMYNYIKTKGGWQFNNADTVIINNNFSQPVDSLFFNVSVPTNNVNTAKMRWDSDLATVVLGLNDNVANELGFKNFWLVKNQTGSTITKGSIVYANGTVGASGRITVAKFIANGTIDAKYLLGITAHDLSNGEDGYVISFGKIRKVNTDTFAAGAILYPSPTVAGVWTDIEPVAPNLDMPIGFCINSHVNNGTIAIRVASGYSLNELHDTRITSPVNNASLYYKSNEALWRDTTAALLVSDTASMLTNYLRTGVAAATYQTKLTNPITGTGTTNYLPKFTGTTALGNSTIFDNGNIGIGTNNPTVAIDLLKSTSSTSAKIRLSTEFASAVRTLTIGSGDGITWEIPSETSQSPYINVNGGDNSVGGGNFYIKTQGTEKFTVRQTGNIGINTLTPSYKLDVNGTFNASGNSLIGGTLGVTGATTLSNLAGSGTRMVTASSTGLLSTQTILTPTTRGSNTFTLPDIGAISFLRYNADNTVSQRGADGMRTDLGGTTIGQSMFTLTNPSAITFPRFNANNTVSALDAASFRTAIGAGTGSGNGTVTSVTAATPNPNGLTVTNSTTTPVISMALAGNGTTGVVSSTTQQFSGAKTFLGDINGSSALNVTGSSTFNGAAIFNSMATTSSLTHLIGVNSSNSVGEITLGSGLNLTSGILSINGAGTFTTTNANYTITSTDTYIAFNNNFSNITITLPTASTNIGRALYFRNTAAGSIVSASNNVINNTVTTGTPDSAILSAGNTNYKWCTLVSDGTYWIKMAAN
jgi:hypothetical protein